jgi:hypothetical protein
MILPSEQADFVSDLHDDFLAGFASIGLLLTRPTARAVRARRIAPVVGGRDHGKKRGETLLDKRSSTASAQEPFVRLEVVLDQVVVLVGSPHFEVFRPRPFSHTLDPIAAINDFLAIQRSSDRKRRGVSSALWPA